MKPTKDGYILSTGKYISANNGIIGLSEPDEDGWQVNEGYDGDISTYIDKYSKSKGGTLNPKECEELADYMIDLWKRFKADVIEGKVKP